MMNGFDLISRKHSVRPIFDENEVRRLLAVQAENDYNVIPKEEALERIISNNDVFIVGGAFQGDEGKGKTVDALASDERVKAVGRANSGANAAHTIEGEFGKVILHLVPSSITNEGVDNYIGENCVMDPVDFMGREISQLHEKGIDISNLYVGNVSLVTPYHKIMDVLRNLPKGFDVNNLRTNNVSTLQGIAPIHASKANKSSPRLDHVFSEKGLAKTVEKDMEAYLGMMYVRGVDNDNLKQIFSALNSDGVKRIPDHILEFVEAGDKISYVVDLFDNTIRSGAFPKRTNVRQAYAKHLAAGDKVILEASQSYFLSSAVDTHCASTTSADTSLAGVFAASGINPNSRVFYINAHKAPGSSRVGKGANVSGFVPQTFYSDKGINTLKDLEGVCEDFDAIQKLFWESIDDNGILDGTVTYKNGDYEVSIGAAMAIAESRKYGETGGTSKKPRVTSFFDCVHHAQVMRDQGPNTTVSAVDRGDNLDFLGLTVGYIVGGTDDMHLESNGKVYHRGDLIKPGEALPTEQVLEHCHPIIRKVRGWKGEPIAADEWNGNLPSGVKEYVSLIEQYTGAEVFSIGNGPKRENLIYLRRK